jgi:hypothetical protein
MSLFVQNGKPLAWTAIVVLFSATGSLCLVSCKNDRVASRGGDASVSISLSRVTHVDEAQEFREVRRVNLLPRGVSDYFHGGMADPGEDFNTTDIGGPNLPRSQLLVAAVSRQYCVVSYVTGGLTIRFRMTVLETSDGVVKVIFDGPGGDRTISGLKEMLETGNLKNELTSKRPQGDVP